MDDTSGAYPDNADGDLTTDSAEGGLAMFSMHDNYVGEDVDRATLAQKMRTDVPGYTNVTHYADDAEREQYLAYVDDQGLYRGADGQLLDSSDTEKLLGGASGIGGHLYTMDESGQSYVVDAKARRDELNANKDDTGVYQHVHHSTLSGGEDVPAAGEKYFEEGQLKAISDGSGHYYDRENPREATQVQQAILSDLDAGADLSETNVHLQTKIFTRDNQTVAIPATDSTVDEFLYAEADQELLHTLQLSTQEYYDGQAAGGQGPVAAPEPSYGD
jgi:hypothetical protein